MPHVKKTPTRAAAKPEVASAPRPLSLVRRIWDSAVLRGPIVPQSDRDRAFVTVHTLLLHLRPVKVPARAIRFTHTFGLGGASLVLLSLLGLTGLLLTLGYQPVPGTAYDSVVGIERDVMFGTLVRGMHHWSANLLVLVMVAHAARVFLTGGYHGPRQFNWVVGVFLLLLVLVSAFTGYLLPWDQLSYWAVTISTGMLAYVPLAGESLQRVARAGTDIGPRTLVVFYTLHTSIVPAILVFALAFHFWRVRKAGGVIVPPPRDGEPVDDEKVMFLPHLLVREVMLALVITAVVVVLAAAFGAPLGDRANPGMSPNPAKAPWYFMGLQELLVHLHPIAAVVIVPAVALLALVLLPYITSDDEPAGAWFLSPRARQAALLAAIIAASWTVVFIVPDAALSSRLPSFSGTTGFVARGIVPLGIIAGVLVALARFVRRRHGLTPNETVQAVVVFLFTAFVVVTMVGVWFRGPGMALAWPWQGGH